jgi:hypothetical protein
LLGADGHAGRGLADHDAPEPRAQIGERIREREDRHDFGSCRELEAALTLRPESLAAAADGDVRECAVTDVDHTPKRDAGGVELGGEAPVQWLSTIAARRL